MFIAALTILLFIFIFEIYKNEKWKYNNFDYYFGFDDNKVSLCYSFNETTFILTTMIIICMIHSIYVYIRVLISLCYCRNCQCCDTIYNNCCNYFKCCDIYQWQSYLNNNFGQNQYHPNHISRPKPVNANDVGQIEIYGRQNPRPGPDYGYNDRYNNNRFNDRYSGSHQGIPPNIKRASYSQSTSINTSRNSSNIHNNNYNNNNTPNHYGGVDDRITSSHVIDSESAKIRYQYGNPNGQFGVGQHEQQSLRGNQDSRDNGDHNGSNWDIL